MWLTSGRASGRKIRSNTLHWHPWRDLQDPSNQIYYIYHHHAHHPDLHPYYAGLTGVASAGPTGVVSEIMKAAVGFGSRWMTDLINNIVKEGCIPDDWIKSILVPVYKGKGDPLVCGSYRAIKLLEQPIKVLERVLEKRIRCQVSIDNMQFGFMPGKGTTDAIFIMRQVQEKHQAKKKKLYYAFVDLEKAFDRVPREVVG